MSDADLDVALRAMLHERARDIATLPPGLTDLDGAAQPDTLPRRQLARWLIAAAVAAVLAVTCGVLLVHGRRHPSDPAGRTTPPPTSRLSDNPPPPTGHSVRQVSTAWFDVAPLRGCRATLRESNDGYRLLALRAVKDPDQPAGCNACESATDYVYVFDRGRFDPAKYGRSGSTPATVQGHPGYRGTAIWYPNAAHRVPTLAWQFAPDRWALVQGVTALGGRDRTLATVAAAVRPTVDVTVAVPFSLASVPELPITQLVDDTTDGYSFVIQLGDPLGRNLAIEIAPHALTAAPRTATARTVVGGRTAWFDPAHLVLDVDLAGGAGLEIGLAEVDGVPPTAADRAQFTRLMQGLTFAHGDGRTPWIPIATAIP